ncbi:MAG: pyridoxal phosphate-dependent aminotransferase [Spirochaetia bacterium]
MKRTSIPLSERKDLVIESPIRKLVPYADAAKKAQIKVFHLNIGQPDIETVPVMRQAYSRPPEIIAYGPSQGLPELREKFAEYYQRHGLKLSMENIYVTSGGSEAITFALMAVTSPGDEIIIPEPYYANYNGFAAMSGAKIVPVTSRIEDGFHLPKIEEFEKAVGPKTKAIMFSNPGNPTGAVFSRERLQELVAFARRHDLFIISDEVYREFTYEGRTAISIMEFEGIEENAIMVDSVSKRYSACGARIGTLVSRNQEVLDLVLRFAQARLCPPTVDQTAVAAAVNNSDEYLERVRFEYKARRNFMVERLQAIDGVRVSSPEGAFYIIAELPVEDTEEFAVWMLRDFHLDGETLMVAPAQGFYASPGLGKKQIRLAYVLTRDKLERAVRILKTALEIYTQKQRA